MTTPGSIVDTPAEIAYKRLRIRLEEKAGRLYGLAWRGKATRPFANYIFKTAAQREQWVTELRAGEDAHETFMAERKQRAQEELAKMRAQLQPGVILHTSWGYDQTNVEFYEVIRVPSAHTVVLREIAGATVETGFMSGTTTAQPGVFVGPELTRRIQPYGIRIDDVRRAYLGGGTKYVSWYA